MSRKNIAKNNEEWEGSEDLRAEESRGTPALVGS